MTRMHMLFAFAAAVFFSASAAAEPKVFTVAGKGPDGAAYTGTVTVSDAIYSTDTVRAFSVEWKIGDAVVTATAMATVDQQRALAIGFRDAAGVGAARAVMNDKGSADVIIYTGAGKALSEVWTPVEAPAAPAAPPTPPPPAPAP